MNSRQFLSTTGAAIAGTALGRPSHSQVSEGRVSMSASGAGTSTPPPSASSASEFIPSGVEGRLRLLLLLLDNSPLSRKRVALWFWLIILSTVLVSVVLNKSNAFLRYYLHIIPIALLMVGIYAIWISRIWGGVPAYLFVGFLLIYHNDSPILEHSQSILTRQFAGNDTFNGPMVEFLKENVKPGERVAVTQNDIGMVAFFYVPRIKWSAILEATNPYNLPYRKSLPAEMFDDYRDVEWVVVWAKRGLPQRVETGYEMVWNYRFGPDISRKAIEQKIHTPQQVTIT